MPRTGGKRVGAGRLHQRFSIDPEHARMLDVLWRYRRAQPHGGALTKTAVLEDVICAAALALPLEVQVAGKLRDVPELAREAR